MIHGTSALQQPHYVDECGPVASMPVHVLTSASIEMSLSRENGSIVIRKICGQILNSL